MASSRYVHSLCKLDHLTRSLHREAAPDVHRHHGREVPPRYANNNGKQGTRREESLRSGLRERCLVSSIIVLTPRWYSSAEVPSHRIRDVARDFPFCEGLAVDLVPIRECVYMLFKPLDHRSDIPAPLGV